MDANNNNSSGSVPPPPPPTGSTNSRRPPSPTGVASPAHPSGCTCGCVHSDFPKALYRNYQGKEAFTGILLLGSDIRKNLFKLHDPNYDCEPGDSLEELAQHGHIMSDKMAEFVLEMSQYDRPDNENNDEDEDDMRSRIKTDIPFKDFADKPDDFVIKDTENFSETFPHGKPGERWTVPEIRSDDVVKVMAVKHIPMFGGQEAKERFWVQVVAVTNTGIVVGISMNSIDSPMLACKNFPEDLSRDPIYDLNEGDLVAFPVTCVFGVKHGDNW